MDVLRIFFNSVFRQILHDVFQNSNPWKRQIHTYFAIFVPTFIFAIIINARNVRNIHVFKVYAR
ncbi:hypothetical protein EO92_01110 [Methanosarcina sp. 2.H.A.1B.4]|nr:hypothetical protein EO92_01110 [Methanosarcina sp. 2.H.A.1B.4]